MPPPSSAQPQPSLCRNTGDPAACSEMPTFPIQSGEPGQLFEDHGSNASLACVRPAVCQWSCHLSLGDHSSDTGPSMVPSLMVPSPCGARTSSSYPAL